MLGSGIVVVVVAVKARFGRSLTFPGTSCTLTLCRHYHLGQTYSAVGRPNRTLGGAELKTGGRDGGRLQRGGAVDVDHLLTIAALIAQCEPPSP